MSYRSLRNTRREFRFGIVGLGYLEANPPRPARLLPSGRLFFCLSLSLSVYCRPYFVPPGTPHTVFARRFETIALEMRVARLKHLHCGLRNGEFRDETALAEGAAAGDSL